VDCNDTNAAVSPGATENCTDGIDNNCNGLIDALDPAAVGCQTCTDSDKDGFWVGGPTCTPVDCNDTNAAVRPGATENCTDGIDNNCNGLIDALDPAAVGCQTCTDSDKDGFWVGGPTCTPVDCDDTNVAIRPSAAENCNDGIDNNCNGLIDGQDPAAVGCQTCTDNDKDGYWVGGPTCSPVDCNDANAAVRPNATENCTDAIDNNCNGLIDGQDPAAVDCQALAPDIDISPATLNFNTVMIGKESLQTLTVQNLGNAALSIDTIRSCPGTSAGFSWLPAGPFTLQANTSMTLSVISAPLHEGTETGCLSISSNDPDESTVEVALQAAGVQSKSILPFLPLLLNPANRQNP
jgi:hypothetical protein